MVNLPPDQPDQPDRRRGDGAWPRENRILDTDELLAVVLAFLGIGSILWWGLSRSQGWLADSSLLPRQGSDSSSLVQPEPAGQADSFEPRTFEPNQRPRPDRPPGVAGSPGWGSESSSSGVTAPAAPPPLVPANCVWLFLYYNKWLAVAATYQSAGARQMARVLANCSYDQMP